jgi:hypothetical protein
MRTRRRHVRRSCRRLAPAHPRAEQAQRGEVEAVRIETQESAIRIIDKTGPLHNPADRDHCLLYMVADEEEGEEEPRVTPMTPIRTKEENNRWKNPRRSFLFRFSFPLSSSVSSV